MTTHCVQSEFGTGVMRRQAGFTLVELLVAMTIFVILATITITAFRGNDDDRVKNSTATVRSALEGARSRAAKAGQVRGLRLLADPNQPRIVTSVVFVGAPAYDEGTLRIDSLTTGSASTPQFIVRRTWGASESPTVWTDLRTNGLMNADATLGLQVPNRIEIPRDSGNWYPVKLSSGEAATVSGFYQPSVFNTTAGSWMALPLDPSVTTPTFTTQSLNINYRLELSPTVLEGSTPILLAQGTGIDLDGSVIPKSWFNNGTGNYSSNLDVLFAPSGDVIGTAKSAGVIHLHVAAMSDLLQAKNVNGLSRSTADQSAISLDPEKLDKLVSLFTHTGAITISELNTQGNTTDGFNNQFYDASTVGAFTANTYPYYFAIHGKEAK